MKTNNAITILKKRYLKSWKDKFWYMIYKIKDIIER